MNKQALLEAAKEAARLAFLAALSAVILYAGEFVNALDPTSLQYVIGTGVLRVIDRYVHKDENTQFNGISPI